MKISTVFISIALIYSLSPPNICLAKISPTTPSVVEFPTNNPTPQQMIEAIQARIEEEPQNPEYYSALAFYYGSIGDSTNELEALKAAVDNLPKDAEESEMFYGNLGRVYLLNGKFDEAKPWLDKADALNFKCPVNRKNALHYHIFKKNYSDAAREIINLTQMLPSDEDYDYYHDAYGFATEQANDRAGSIHIYQEALKINPRDFRALRLMGIVTRDLSRDNMEQRLPEIMGYLKASLRLSPRYLPTYITIADTYMMVGIVKDDKKYVKPARVWFQKAQRLFPDDPKLNYALGNFYLWAEDYDKEIALMERVLKSGVTDDEIDENLALAYGGKAYGFYKSGKNLDEGLVLIEKAIALRPENGLLISTKAGLLYKKGDYATAYDYIKKAMALKPDQAEIQQDLKMIEAALNIQEARK